MEKQNSTKERVFIAFSDLVEKKRFEYITIVDILECANISRSQFYRLFKDKYDLLEQTVSYQCEMILTDDYELDSLSERFELLCKMFDESKLVLAMQYKFSYEQHFNLLFEANVRQYCRRLRRSSGSELSEEMMQAIRFCSAGYAMIMFDWIRNGNRESIMNQIRQLRKLVPDILVSSK